MPSELPKLSHRQNGSDDSAPERAKTWQRDILLRRGALTCEWMPNGDVVCLDAEGKLLSLSPVGRPATPPPLSGVPAVLSFPGQFGILSLSGVLRRGAGQRPGAEGSAPLLFEVDSDGVKKLNRRDSYRVSVSLKGEILGLGPSELSSGESDLSAQVVSPMAEPKLEELGSRFASRARPVVIQDLSLGGARLAVAPPGPAPGDQALLHLKLGIERGDALRNLPCVVLERSEADRTVSAPAHLLRVRFHPLTPSVEGRLSRFLSKVQLERSKTAARRP